VPTHPTPSDSRTINLKDPALAAFLAWLWPGAGHLYQGRRAKGFLFMASILGTFFFGFFLGDGRVVYASWKPEPFRWSYLCQACVGLPALPALVEAKRARSGREGLFPNDWFQPPTQVADSEDELDRLQKRLHHRFEFGSIYTMIAGLLNVLVIYDAFGGPAYAGGKREEEESAAEDAPDEAAAKA
jgi:TM2 domain-containing membrane protein YozV